uniref:Uncharacterized protein n=1 Tax=Sphaerodactylus townsendi TaxID=933632 RepID=A0ACB8FZX7_9SAUR
MTRLRWLLCAALWLAPGSAFNLDADSPAVYAGSPGTYFGFAVDFFAPDPASRADKGCGFGKSINHVLRPACFPSRAGI